MAGQQLATERRRPERANDRGLFVIRAKQAKDGGSSGASCCCSASPSSSTCGGIGACGAAVPVEESGGTSSSSRSRRCGRGRTRALVVVKAARAAAGCLMSLRLPPCLSIV
uniref:Uncharacterized protein n=1 Tax=Arundo donax TaxID=35708 RepID=A0A0A9AT85_ARUDO